MEKEFVPYELAVKLKELGFDEKCFCNWEESWSPEPEDEIRMVLTTDQTWLRDGWVRAPTFSQAFRWFREKYNLYHNIDKHGYWFFEIKKDEGYGDLTDVVCCFDFESYEEAEQACLIKLIEIVNKNIIKMKELFALTVLRIINLGFSSNLGKNPNLISLENRKGQKVYVTNNDTSIKVRGYKVTARCLNIDISSLDEMFDAVLKIKEKLITEDNEN